MDESIEIVEIKSISDYKKFVNFQFRLYSDNLYWIPPIINEEIDDWDQPYSNPMHICSFGFCTAHLFIEKNKQISIYIIIGKKGFI